MIQTKQMFYFYDRYHNFELKNQKRILQDLYDDYYKAIEPLKNYEYYLEQFGTSTEELSKGIFKELNPNDFSDEGRVVNILYNQCHKQYQVIAYLQPKYERQKNMVINLTTFNGIIKKFFSYLIEEMFYNKYEWGDYRIGYFKVYHRAIKNTLNYKESYRNKEALIKEGVYKEGMEWVKSDIIYLCVGWRKKAGLAIQLPLKKFTLSLSKSTSSASAVLNKAASRMSKAELLQFPPFSETYTKKIKQNENDNI